MRHRAVPQSCFWVKDGYGSMLEKRVKDVTVVEIVYIEQIDWMDLDCSRKLSIVVNVILLTLRHV